MIRRIALTAVVLILLSPSGAIAAPAHDEGRSECSASRTASAEPACTDVRPGGPVWTDRVLADHPCTLNFVFKGYRYDEDGRRIEVGTFIATAGHCAVAGDGVERVWDPGEGPTAWDQSDREIGRFAYARADGIHDFGLILLHPDVIVSPQMCLFGGPTGVNTELSDEPSVLRLAGQGMVIREVASGRQIVARHMPDPEVAYAVGPGINGDSGSPVIDDQGRAVGVMTGIALDTEPLEANLQIVRIAPHAARAAEQLDLELDLQTADLLA